MMILLVPVVRALLAALPVTAQQITGKSAGPGEHSKQASCQKSASTNRTML